MHTIEKESDSSIRITTTTTVEEVVNLADLINERKVVAQSLASHTESANARLAEIDEHIKAAREVGVRTEQEIGIEALETLKSEAEITLEAE